jgi:hypothetical protein
VRVRGSKGDGMVRDVFVYRGSSYTVMPRDVLEDVGAWRMPFKVSLELVMIGSLRLRLMP